MSVIRTCCNKELVTSCPYGCDNRYCTNNDVVTYSPVDMSCSGYVNRTVYSALLREEVWRRDAEESSGTY
jgi:hypothetical protein